MRKNYPKTPSFQVSIKVSFTISPFINKKRVIIDEVVSENFTYFQKMHEHKNTNPKKKGKTPNKNIIILVDAFESVDDIKFIFLLNLR